MECLLKFSLPNWYTIILVTKRERVKGFFKRERVKGFFIFMTMPSFKQVESNYGKKESCERGCSWIIKFSHCLNLDTVNLVLFFQFELKMAVHAAKKSVK